MPAPGMAGGSAITTAAATAIAPPTHAATRNDVVQPTPERRATSGMAAAI